VKALETDKVTVKVVNGSGVKNAGSVALSEFTAAASSRPVPPRMPTRATTRRRSSTRPESSAGLHRGRRGRNAEPRTAATAKQTLGGDALLIVGTDYGSLKHGFAKLPKPANLPSTTKPSVTTSTSSTTSTTVPHTTVNTSYIPVDPKTGAPWSGAPPR